MPFIFVFVVAWLVVVWGAIIVRHARQRDRAHFDDLRAQCQPIIGAARVGWWNMSIPLAVVLITDTTLFVGGRWRYLPGAVAAVTHDDVERIEYTTGIAGKRLNIVRRNGKRLSFIGPDVTDLLRDHGWQVERNP